MDDYFWHQPLWQHFIHLNQQQRIAHAVLMSGAKGLAKTALAQQMCQFQLCLSNQDAEQPCGHCHSCQLFAADAHPDHLFIGPEESGKAIKIDQIRLLKSKQALTPTISRWKTVIVHPAHKMTLSASNSLLKLLEEPAANTLILLVGSRPEMLPITIRSRCHQMHLAAPDKMACKQWLLSHNISITDTDFDSLWMLAKGAPLAIKKLIENDAAAHYQKITSEFEQLLQQRVNPITLAASWLQHDVLFVMRVLQYTLQHRLQQLTQTPSKQAEILQGWAIADCIVETIKLISSQHNYNKTLLIEDFIVSLMRCNTMRRS